MRKLMRKVTGIGEAGFTLMEMLIVVLIVGILAAIAGPLYIGYTRDARMSEAKAVAGNLWSAMQGCAQTNPGVACGALAQYPRAGFIGTATADGQWDAGAGAQTATFDNATNKYTLSAPLQINGVAAKVVANLAVQYNYVAANNPPGSFLCSTDAAKTFNPC